MNASNVRAGSSALSWVSAFY